MVCQVSKLIACTAKSRTVREDCERICFAFTFACVVGKNPKTPKLNPMADDAITRVGIGSLVSPSYICGADIGVQPRFSK